MDGDRAFVGATRFSVGRKEMFYLTTHLIHFIYGLYGVGHMVEDHSDSERGRREGRKEMFYLTTHSTHFIYGLYGVKHMVEDHSDSERGNLAAATWATLSD